MVAVLRPDVMSLLWIPIGPHNYLTQASCWLVQNNHHKCTRMPGLPEYVQLIHFCGESSLVAPCDSMLGHCDSKFLELNTSCESTNEHHWICPTLNFNDTVSFFGKRNKQWTKHCLFFLSTINHKIVNEADTVVFNVLLWAMCQVFG